MTNLVHAKNSTLECNEETEQCTLVDEWQFSLSVGVGLRTNPLFQSNNIPLIVLPGISYYAENFFIENLDIGYNLYDSAKNTFNIIATPSYDSVFFNRWDPSNLLVEISPSFFSEPIPIDDTLNSDTTITDNVVADNSTQINSNELNKRKFGYLAGIEYSYQIDKNLLQLNFLTDISKRHSGSELRFAYAYSFHQTFSTTLGFTWKDSKLTDYYYGIDANEIVDDRAVYEADTSFSPFIRFSLNTPSSNQNNWKFSLEYLQLDNQISRSAIVDNDYIITFFAGKTFTF